MSEVATITMTEQEASKLTERIRITAHNFAEAQQKLMELVAEAKDGNAHVALGYASWTAYLSDVLGDEPMRLARGERQEMVSLLSGEGMSTRAIAPIVGANNATVSRDLASVANATDQPEPRKVESMDGITRTYTRTESALPEPQEPPKSKRRPITDRANDAGWELRSAVEKIQRVYGDDRFTTHKEKVATHLRGHLQNAVEVCQDLLDQIN